MNNFLLFILSLVGLQAVAQVKFEGLDKTYTQAIDSLLTYVSKDSITTGILYDRAFSFNDYIDRKDTIHTGRTEFIETWNVLHTASYTPGFDGAETVKQNLVSVTGSLIFIGVINAKVNYIEYATDSVPNLELIDG